MTQTTTPTSNQRRVLLAGASGLVGGFLLEGLLNDASVSEVHVLGRRALARQHEKIREYIVDFTRIPALPAVDEVYLALGTTIKLAGSQEAFRAVDYDANLAVAQAALKFGAKRLGLVSAMGANASSAVFYNRVKGQLEDTLQALTTKTLVIARPSLLMGNRQVLGQVSRPGERISQVIMGSLKRILPANVRPITAEKVAKGLLAKVPLTSGVLVLSSAELQAY